MYEKAHSPSAATAYYSDAKEALYTAISIANELGLTEEAAKLDARLEHIKGVFRSQFT
jgi:predicted transcriptional regulator